MPLQTSKGDSSPFLSRSHIVLNFVTSLPHLQGNPVILTIVVRVSKTVHFIALPKPTNGQTVRANQDLEAAFCCISAQDPASWVQLTWVEYAYNSLTITLWSD